LYGMRKKRFYSKLFNRYIETDEFDYDSKVYGELLYRIKELEEKDCPCPGCKSELDKYYTTLYKIKKPPPNVRL